MTLDRDLFVLLCISTPGVVLLIAFQCFLFFYQRPYIIKRYEEETDLGATERMIEPARPFMVFKNMKVVIYTAHLMMTILMSDRMVRKINLRDSPNRKEILGHFSKKERVIALVAPGCGFLVMALLVSSSLLDYLWK